MRRKYASPPLDGLAGRLKLTINSPFFKFVLPGPAVIFSTGRVRRPSGPAMLAVMPAATIAGTLSPAGEALHRFPPSEALP